MNQLLLSEEINIVLLAEAKKNKILLAKATGIALSNYSFDLVINFISNSNYDKKIKKIIWQSYIKNLKIISADELNYLLHNKILTQKHIADIWHILPEQELLKILPKFFGLWITNKKLHQSLVYKILTNDEIIKKITKNSKSSMVDDYWGNNYWINICCNWEFPEELIIKFNKYLCLACWERLAKHQNLSETFIEKNLNKFKKVSECFPNKTLEKLNDNLRNKLNVYIRPKAAIKKKG